MNVQKRWMAPSQGLVFLTSSPEGVKVANSVRQSKQGDNFFSFLRALEVMNITTRPDLSFKYCNYLADHVVIRIEILS